LHECRAQLGRWFGFMRGKAVILRLRAHISYVRGTPGKSRPRAASSLPALLFGDDVCAMGDLEDNIFRMNADRPQSDPQAVVSAGRLVPVTGGDDEQAGEQNQHQSNGRSDDNFP
jgi:hypothetical protein